MSHLELVPDLPHKELPMSASAHWTMLADEVVRAQREYANLGGYLATVQEELDAADVALCEAEQALDAFNQMEDIDAEERKISEMVDRRIEADIDMWDDRQPPEDEDV